MSFTEKLKQMVSGSAPAQEMQHTDVRSVLLSAPDHIQEGQQLADKFIIPDAANVQHLTFVGMGGSMHPAFLLRTYLENIGCKKQLNIIRDYTIPSWVSKKGFLILISYSGNTAETLSAYRQAYREGYKMLVITAGGKLKESAEKNGISLLVLPSGYQPRHSVYIMIGALLQILQNSGIIEKHEKLIEEAVRILHKPIFETMGKQLAEKINGKIPVIYTTSKLGDVAQRWKICFNENTKIHSFCNIIPELNHNELNAYITRKGAFHILFLVDDEETKAHRSRISATKLIVKEEGYPTTEIVIKGPSYLARLLSAVHIGDWTSYYYAKHMGVDPAQVAVIERFKKLLDE
ncbi:bifunctional phosphoglucose/phosphomannose isomerase [Candidatus Woesearchaeota archaeon]|nr:bifunctional phosphoglucose/phosphomannose isomerase [Candidatus Woesearchaeota archaeon]